MKRHGGESFEAQSMARAYILLTRFSRWMFYSNNALSRKDNAMCLPRIFKRT